MKRIICLFFILAGIFSPVYSDIIEDAVTSIYVPILAIQFDKFNYTAIIVTDENNLTSWTSNFGNDEFNELFSEFSTIADYIKSVDIPYANLKNQVLPDFVWYDSARDIMADTYWDPDIKCYVTYIFRNNDYSRATFPLVNEKIDGSVSEINKQINFIVNLLERHAGTFNYVYMSVDEKQTQGDYIPEILVETNNFYSIYNIWGLKKHLTIYLSNWNHETFWQKYDVYANFNKTAYNLFFQDLKTNLIEIGFRFAPAGWEVLRFN